MQLIINELVANGGELTDELQQMLEITQSELNNKATGYAQVIRAMQYDNDIVDAEIKRLQEIKRVRKNAVERLKNALSGAMQQFDMDVIETPISKISFRSSQTVEIWDETLVPNEYKQQVITTKVDKLAIKKAIKNGESVTGATVVNNKNIQIK